MSGWAWVRIGAVLGFLAVGLGAFGAHGLKERLELLGTTATFQTAAQYHMYHALALIALGLFIGPFRGSIATAAAALAFLFGVLIFSGSLYVLSVTGETRLGAITPIGGVLLLIGWIAFAIAAGSAIPGTPPAGWSTDPAASAPVTQPANFDFEAAGIESESDR